MERAIDFYKAVPILSSVWNILTGGSSGAARDGKARKRRMRGGKGYLGVWDPTGGEVREGSGLPVERGAEEIWLRCFSLGEGLGELEHGELGAVESCRMRRDERSEAGIRRLTVLAGIIGPMTLLVGWWGANFDSIPGSGSQWGFGVFVVGS